MPILRIFIFLFLIQAIAYADELQNFPGQIPFLPIKALSKSSSINMDMTNTASDTKTSDTHLSLQEAIYLGLKHNTDLLTRLNNRQLERFDLLTAQQKFEPQVSLSNSVTYAKTEDQGSPNFTTKSASIGPDVSWELPFGTKLDTSLNYAPASESGADASSSNQIGYSITVTQPLLQNFGTKANTVDLDNAYDQQIIDDLTLEKTVETTIINIASAYYAVVSANQSYTIAQQSYQEAQKELEKRKARLTAGQIPETDLTQAQIDLITQEQSVEAANEALATAKADFLNTLGLPTDTLFKVDDHVDAEAPSSDITESLKQALKNNIDLKTEALQSKQDERNILKSKNARLWDLELVLSRSRTHSTITYINPDLANTSQLSDNSSASLSLSIPLNQVTLDQNELSSAISLENQQIAEAQQKRTIVNNVVAAVHNLQSQWLQLQIAQEKLSLSKSSYEAAQIKYQYGKIDAFSLQQQQESNIQAEQNVVDLRINYLKQVMTYEQLTGSLLNHWHVNIEAAPETQTSGSWNR